MNWKNTQRHDKRIKTKFCLFPRTIGESTYWLETITIEQEYDLAAGPYGTYHLDWFDVKVIQE